MIDFVTPPRKALSFNTRYLIIVTLAVALVEISASFQMLEYALKRLTDAVDGRSLYQPTLKIALSNYNLVDLSTGLE